MLRGDRGHYVCLSINKFIIFLTVLFIWFTVSPSILLAQRITSLNLPLPGSIVNPTSAYVPVLLKGLTIDTEDPFQFNFIVDNGNTNFVDVDVQRESQRLINYFLAAMTVPQDDFWVNLSPHESDRIIPDELAKTALGRDLLAQDYLLKQLTASLVNPETELGTQFWNNMRSEALEKFGISEIPTELFNKVWIMPDEATVYEHDATVYVVDAKLKVLTDVDYMSLEKELDQRLETSDQQPDLTTKIVNKILIPAIEKEVNQGENFAPLRQIYHSLILAKWYKETIKNSLLSKIYIDQNKVSGTEISSQTTIIDEIYNQYIEAYKVGVFSFIKEDYDALSQEMIPRKYFSGGIIDRAMKSKTTTDAQLVLQSSVGKLFWLVFQARLNMEEKISMPTKWHAYRLQSKDVEVRSKHYEIILGRAAKQEPLALQIIGFAQGLLNEIPESVSLNNSYDRTDKMIEFLPKALSYQKNGDTFFINYTPQIISNPKSKILYRLTRLGREKRGGVTVVERQEKIEIVKVSLEGKINRLIEHQMFDDVSFGFVLDAIYNGLTLKSGIKYLKFAKRKEARRIVKLYDKFIQNLEKATKSKQFNGEAMLLFKQVLTLVDNNIEYEVKFNDYEARFKKWDKVKATQAEIDEAARMSLLNNRAPNLIGRWVTPENLLEIIPIGLIDGKKKDAAMLDANRVQLVEVELERINQLFRLVQNNFDGGVRKDAIDDLKKVTDERLVGIIQQRLQDLSSLYPLREETFDAFDKFAPIGSKNNPTGSYEYVEGRFDNTVHFVIQDLKGFFDEADSAMRTEEVGGIDFNDIKVDRQGNGVDIQFDLQAIEPFMDMNINGLTPTSIQITPLNNMLPILGLEDNRTQDEVIG